MDSILTQLAAYYSLLFPYDSLETIRNWLNGYRAEGRVKLSISSTGTPERMAASAVLALIMCRTQSIRPTCPANPILITESVSSTELPMPMSENDYAICASYMRSVGYLTDVFGDAHSDVHVRYVYSPVGTLNGTFRYVDHEFEHDPVLHRRLYDAYVKLYSFIQENEQRDD